jgi:hypothetical protein
VEDNGVTAPMFHLIPDLMARANTINLYRIWALESWWQAHERGGSSVMRLGFFERHDIST